MADIRSRLVAQIPRLRRYARALTRDVAAADDLVQDCLTRAVSKRHLWQDATDLRAWLFTILRNQYVNQVRRAGCEGKSAALCDAEPVTMAPRSRKAARSARSRARAPLL
jgi:RNA polymerase sigma-70 factor, ECF subfamily